MEKIVIIGSAGAGKSTLAQELGSILNIKVYHLDRIFWQRGWKEKPRDTRIDILQKILREKQWIIEGTYLSSSEPRLNAADTIIFLDVASSLCLQRIIKRYLKYHGRSRRDIPEGCTDKLNLIRILKVLGFPFRGRRTLKQKLRKFPPEKVIWLHSTKEVEAYLAQLEPHADEKRQFSKPPPVAGKSTLARKKKVRTKNSQTQKDELIIIVIDLRTSTEDNPDIPLRKTFRAWMPTNEKNAFFSLIALIYLIIAVIHFCMTGDISMFNYLLGAVAGWAGVKEIVDKINQKNDKSDL